MSPQLVATQGFGGSPLAIACQGFFGGDSIDGVTYVVHGRAPKQKAYTNDPQKAAEEAAAAIATARGDFVQLPLADMVDLRILARPPKPMVIAGEVVLPQPLTGLGRLKTRDQELEDFIMLVAAAEEWLQ